MVRLAPKRRKRRQAAAAEIPDESMLEEVPLGDIPDYLPYVRCDDHGAARGNVGSVTILSKSSEHRGLGSYCEYVSVVENRQTGATYLVPAPESNANKLGVRWAEANHAFYISLRKYLIAKRFKVARNHTWLIPCAEGRLKDGAVLELKLKEAVEEPVSSSTSTGAPAPAQPATPELPEPAYRPADPAGAAQGLHSRQ